MTRDQDSAISLTKHFPAALKRYRELRGWTQPQLAERCKAAGLDWERPIVANVESGRRGAITLQELATLGYVLSVPPVLLLLPLGTGQLVEIVPGVEIHPHLALKWLVGDELPMTSRGEIAEHVDMENFALSRLPLRLYHQHDAAQEAREQGERLVFREERIHGSDSTEAAAARAAYAAALETLVEVLRRMAEAGMRPPAQGRGIHDEVKAYGLVMPTGVGVIEPEED